MGDGIRYLCPAYHITLESLMVVLIWYISHMTVDACTVGSHMHSRQRNSTVKLAL